MSNLHGELLSVHKIKPGLTWYSKDAKTAKRTTALRENRIYLVGLRRSLVRLK
jgi:hypothetical protein